MDPFASYAAQLETSALFLGLREGGRIENLNFYAGEIGGYQDAVLPTLGMGEETSDDYLPGTILLGARTGPDQPWIVGRNAGGGELLSDGTDGPVTFRYDFGMLDGIEGTGSFAEIEGAALPTVRWTIRLRNRLRTALEIGELGFPFAFNNLAAPNGRTDDAIADVIDTRFHLHPFAGGAASFLAVTRMNGMPPTLLVVPQGDGWEFSASIPASLRTPFPWEGIPAVYVHSRATVDREEWPEWINGHTSIVLEPGDERTYEIDLVAILDPSASFDIAGTMARLGRPGLRFREGGVAPVSQGVAVEVTGVRPTRFWTDRESTLEIDSNSDGGTCLVEAKRPGPIRISFEDENGGISHAHGLLVPEPQRALSRWARRAARLRKRRKAVRTEEGEGTLPLPPGSLLEVESDLADALLLATLARRTGMATEAPARMRLDAMLGRAIDPTTLGVAAGISPDLGVGTGFGHPRPGLLLGAALEAIGGDWDSAALRAWERALETADPDALEGSGWAAAQSAAHLAGDTDLDRGSRLAARGRRLLEYRYPFLSGRGISLEGMAEAMEYALAGRDSARVKRYCRMILAAKSPAPHWWTFGTDRRIGGPFENDRPEWTNPLALDRGALAIAPWSAAHSALVLRAMAEGYVHPMEGTLALLEAGRRAPMALVREDGEATMTLCPDAGSMQFGSAPFGGDAGLALTGMIEAGLVVIDRQPYGPANCGARAETVELGTDKAILVEPTLPCREIRLPFLGVTLVADGATIERARIDLDRERVALALRSWGRAPGVARVQATGLWGDLPSGDGPVEVTLDDEGRGEIELVAVPVDDAFGRPGARPAAHPRQYPLFRESDLPRRYEPAEEGAWDDEDDEE